MDLFNIGDFILEMVELVDFASDGKEMLSEVSIGNEDNYVAEKLKDKGKNMEILCPNCSKEFFYWIENEKVAKIHNLEPVDIITTCPFCQKTFSSFFKLKSDYNS